MDTDPGGGRTGPLAVTPLSERCLRRGGRPLTEQAVKPTSAEEVADLKRLGLTPVLLTGDNTAAAHAGAAEVGIEADLGLAMGTGTDAAIAASDLTLVRGDLRGAADAIRLARRTLRTIKANLFWGLRLQRRSP